MDINTAARILFGKDYEELNDSQADEAHDFREMQEQMQEQMAHDEMISQDAWWES